MAKITIQGPNRFRPTSTGLPRAGQVGDITGGTRGTQELTQTITNLSVDAINKRDRALDLDYVTDANVKAQTEIQKLRDKMLKDVEDPKGFSQSFAEEANKVYDRYLGDAPSQSAANSLKNMFSSQKTSQFKRAFDLENQMIADRILDNAIENSNTIGIEVFDNPASFQDKMKDLDMIHQSVDGVLDPKAKEVLKDKTERQLVDSYLRGLIDKDLAKAEEVANSDDIKGMLSPKEIVSYRNAVEAQKDRIESETVRKIAADMEAARIDRSLGIFRGEVNQLQLDQDLASGTFDKNTYLKLSKELEARNSKIQTQDNSIRSVEAQIRLGQPFDTTAKATRDNLDNYFDAVVVPNMTEENAEEVVATFIQDSSYIPTSVKSNLLATLHNGNNDQIAKSAKLIDRLVKDDPQLANQFQSTRDIVRSRQIANSINAGMPIEMAIQGADTSLVEKNTTEHKERSKAFKDSKKKFKQGELTSFFVNDPNNVPKGLINDFETLYMEFAVNNKMDIKEAEDLAYTIIKRDWTISEATGEPKYVKHAPEIYYNKRGLDPIWIQRQLRTDVSSLIPEVEDYDLSVIPDTIGTANPSYTVDYLSENGIPLKLRDAKGRLLRWRPDINQSQDVKDQITKVEDEFKLKRRRQAAGQLFEESLESEEGKKKLEEFIKQSKENK